MLSNQLFFLFSHVGMQPANVQLGPKHSVVGGLDIGVSNAPTTLETIIELCLVMYGLHVRMNDN